MELDKFSVLLAFAQKKHIFHSLHPFENVWIIMIHSCKPYRHTLEKRLLLMLKVLRKWTQKKYSFQWRIYWRGPKGPGPPLFLDQTEAPRAEKNFFWDRASPFSQGLDDRAPALSECLDSPLHLRIELDLIYSLFNLIIDCYLYHLLHRHRHLYRHHHHYYTDDLVIRRQKYSDIRLKNGRPRET